MKRPAKSYRIAAVFLPMLLCGVAAIYAGHRVREIERREAAVSLPVAPVGFPSAAAGFSVMQSGFDVRQSVIAGGGGRSSGGNFQVEDTIGQSLVGQSIGGNFAVTDGFWGGDGVAQTVGFTIAGRVSYGDIGAISVPGAIVGATSLGVTISSPPSGNDGRYAISNVSRGTYGLQGQKNTSVGDIDNITPFDAARILQRRLNNDPFRGLEVKTADVDGNGVVDERDAQMIANFVVGKTGSGNAGNWYLEAVNKSTVDVTGNLPDQNFKAVLVGDVSGNWSAGAALAIAGVTPVDLTLKTAATGRETKLAGVTIRGEGFAPGLILVVGLPDGGEMRLREPQLLDVTSESFTALTALRTPGSWVLQVVHPDGRKSNPVVVKVE